MNEYYSETTMREIRLEKLRVAAQTVVSERLLYDMNIDITEEIHNHLLATIRGNLLKLGKGATMDIQYPADWWQSFKERWFPEWALSRWPVQYKTHHIRAEAIFPEASQRFDLESRFGPSYVTLFEDDPWIR